MPHEMKSIYEQLGEEKFIQLVGAFYRHVAADAVLRPLYPEQDLTGAEERLRLFLIQYFGGPTTYSNQRGHPRLKMRHIPFHIAEAERNAWVKAMLGAMDEVQIPEPAYTAMRDYFENAATFMINAQ